jgi:Flp pilus assembly protein TadD
MARDYQFIDAPKPELYDLRSDTPEAHNLIGQKKAVSDVMQAELRTEITRLSSDRKATEQTGLDPAMAERLKALGYAAVPGGGAVQTSGSGSSLPDPKDRIATYELISDAISDSQHGHIADSAEKLNRALQTEPDSVPIHYLLGIDRFRMRQFDAAVAEFQRVMTLSPNYALASFYLGLSLGEAGQYEAAAQALSRALELDATNFSAAFNLGAVDLKLGRVDEAMAAFRRSVQIYPDYAEGHRGLGELLLYKNDLSGARAELETAARLAPNDPRVHISMAKLLRAEGNIDEAQAEQERARQLVHQP